MCIFYYYSQPLALRQQVLHAFTRSLATIWIVNVPIAFVGLLLGSCGNHLLLFIAHLSHNTVLLVRQYTLKQQVVRNPKIEKDKPAGAKTDDDADTENASNSEKKEAN